MNFYCHFCDCIVWDDIDQLAHTKQYHDSCTICDEQKMNCICNKICTTCNEPIEICNENL